MGIKNGSPVSQNKANCSLCNTQTNRTDQRCERCFALEAAIVESPELVALIVERLLNSRDGFAFKLNIYKAQVDLSIHLTDHSFSTFVFTHFGSGVAHA